MRRGLRMTLAAGVVLVLGLSVLAYLATQYRQMAAQRSVEEITAEGSGTSDTSEAPQRDVADLVDRFIQVRQRLNETIETRRVIRWLDPETGNLRRDVNAAQWIKFHDLLGELKLVWHEACAEVGLGEEEYVRVRAAFREWVDGKPLEDEALARAFEERAEVLQGLHLGNFEFLDGGRPASQDVSFGLPGTR